jgi:hypothetical protein
VTTKIRTEKAGSRRLEAGGLRRGVCRLGALALLTTLTVLLAPSQAKAWDFMDTRITWTFGDDDVLATAGEVFPESPLPGIGDRDGYELFFDNLDSQYTGREHQTELVMYKRMPSLLDERLTIEAGVVMRVDFEALYGHSADVNGVFRDDGSYIRMVFNWNHSRPSDGLEIVLFPISTERFRVGYLYDLSWGGGGIFTRMADRLTPGLKLQLRVGNFYYFIGLKTAVINQEVEAPAPDTALAETEHDIIGLRETNYGGLTGLGIDATPWLRLDLSGGIFQSGTFPINGLRTEGVYSYGGAARVVFHQGIPVGMSSDFRLYRNDPETGASISRGEQYTPGQLSWYLSAEGGVIAQHLADADTFAGTTDQVGYAFALQFRLKYSYFRAHLTGFIRNAAYMLHNVPSLVPFFAISAEGVTMGPQIFGALGADYRFERAHLTLGGILGVEMPAYYASDTSDVTVVIGDHGIESRLPQGDDPYPVIAARVSAQWDLAEFLSLIAFVQYVRDSNQTRLEVTEWGTRRIYLREDQLGFALMAQARF